jgi:TonB family protein
MSNVVKQDIFTFIDSEPIYVRIRRELSEAAKDFRKDPRKFVANLFQGDSAAAKRKKYLRMGIAFSTFFWLTGCVLYIGWYYWRPPVAIEETSELQKIVDLTPFPVNMPKTPKPENAQKAPGKGKAQRVGGGGGGGNREQTPPSKGRPPVASMTQPQIVAPTTHTRVENPSLPVLPTIQVNPDLVAKSDPDIPLGVPTGVPGPPSDGPGKGGGIGTGAGGGVGSGDGTGLGPGKGKGTGGGSYAEGDGGGVYSAGVAGVRSPQILSRQKPKYTEDARRDKIQGIVVLSAVFRKDGTVSDIKVVKGLGYGLDEEAIKAANLIKFVPGTKDGQPVNVRAKLEFTFSLL